MRAIARVPADSSSHTLLWSLRVFLRNIFQLLGFEPASDSRVHRSRKPMSHSSHSWSIFPSLPHDYMRRRRVLRRISNIVLVVLLSAAIAYAIVYASGPSAFPAPHR